MKKILSFRLLAIAIAALLCGTSNAQIILNSDINVASQRSVDGKQYHVVGNKHYPYKDTANFLSTIPKTRRHVGEISYIFNSDSSAINIWQFVGGIENNNLVNVSALYYKKPEVDSIIDNSMVKDITWGVIDSIRNAPSSPIQGDRYLVSTSATGAFAGKQNLIATYDTTLGWQFQSALKGDLLYNSSSYKTYKWTGTVWELRPPPLVENWWSRTAWNGAAGQFIQTGAKNDYLTMFGSLNGNSVGLGRQVFTDNPTGGNGNTAIGAVSQYHIQGGYNNTSLGLYSLWYNVSGHDQVAIGRNALNTGNKVYSIGLGTFAPNNDRTFSISDSTTKMYMKLDTTGTAPKWMVGRNDNGFWNSYRLSNVVAQGGSGIFIPLSEKGQANGVPNLDAGGKVPVSQLPALTVNQPSYVQHLSDMLSSGAVVGDIVVVGDSSKSYALMTAPASTFSNWLELQSPVPTNTDLLPEGSTNKYYTDIRSRNAISSTGRVTYNNSTGEIGVTSPDWNVSGDILNKPTIPAELTPFSGNNISITGTFPYLQWDVTGIYTKTQSDSISTKLRGEVADTSLLLRSKINALITDGSSSTATTYSSDKINSLIAGAGGGDMLKSVYDPTNVNGDAFDYNNLYNKPTIPDVSGKLNKSDSSLYTTVTRLKDTASALRNAIVTPTLQEVLTQGGMSFDQTFYLGSSSGIGAVSIGFSGSPNVNSGTIDIVNSRGKVLTIGAKHVDSNYVVNFPKIHISAGSYVTLPMSVNGNYADSTGNITIASGSGSNNPDSLAGYKGIEYLRKTEAATTYEPIISTKNTAFNKNFGTSAGTVSEGNHTHTFASLTSKPTTIGGYGITDGITKSQLTDSLNARMQGDTVSVNTPLHIKHGAKDTLYMTQASGTDSGWVSKEQVNSWNGKIGGSVASGQVAFGNGSGLSGDNGLYWDNTNKRLGIGTTTPSEKLDVVGNAKISGTLKVGNKDYDSTVSAKQDKLISINTQTASYTLVLADGGKLVRQNVASANTVTVPPNSSVAYPIGTQINIVQVGAGQVTVTAGSGVTINSADSKLKTRVQYSTVTLIKTATDTWLLMGDIAN